MSNRATPPRRREPLRARPPSTDASPTTSTRQTSGGASVARASGLRIPPRFGGASVLAGAGQIAGVAAAVGREMATNTANVTREVVQQASSRQPASTIATTILNGWVTGAVRAVAVIEETTDLNVGAPVAESQIRGTPQQTAGARRLADSVAHELPGGARELENELVHLASATIEARSELRRRGRELLQRSTLLDDPDEHPAFRSILNDMSPDEARIVCFLAQAGPQPTVELLEIDRMKRSTRKIAHHVSLIGQEAGCIRPKLAATYLDNLERLGVVFVQDFRSGTQEDYELLYAQPDLEDAKSPERWSIKHQVRDRSVELSTFGRQLYELCFADGDE